MTDHSDPPHRIDTSNIHASDLDSVTYAALTASPQELPSRASSSHIKLSSPDKQDQLALSPMPMPISRTKSSRSIRGGAARLARETEEQELLLDDDSVHEIDDRGNWPPRNPKDLRPVNPHADLPVYTTIHRIKMLMIASIDDPYDIEQLKSPRMNTNIVRPLVEHLYDPNDPSIVYCLLVNRAHFIREQSYQQHHQSVNMTRANLCEIVASRVLRRYDENTSGREGLLLIANILVAGFEPYQNAPLDVKRQKPMRWSVAQTLNRESQQKMLTALEVAIVSESKLFLSSTSCQKLVDAVWRGRITYTPTAWLDLVPDRYKSRGISIYDPRRAPILNQYRLIVPRTRNIVETTQFFVLFLLYVWMMYSKGHRQGPEHLVFSTAELIFDIYAVGWIMDELTSVLEHGWSVHTENLWSFLDLTFVVIFVIHFILRMHGFAVDDHALQKQALDVLALAAPVLLPRLAFCLMSESMLFIALRAMMADFFFLSVLAAWLFGGFLLALRWLSQSSDGIDSHSTVTIAKWLLMLWFGLDGTGLSQSAEMHPLIGPAITVLFALLGNTLFLTILVAMLSDTYSKLAASKTAEIQYRRAVLTFEGVKSDALFSYPPPFNVVFLFVLLPLKLALSPRWFHKMNVVFVRVLNGPVLLAISVYERAYLWQTLDQKRNSAGKTSFWGSFGAHADLVSVFEQEPPESVLEVIDALDGEFEEAQLENWGWEHRSGHTTASGVTRSNSVDVGLVNGVHGVTGRARRRRLSTRQVSDGASYYGPRMSWHGRVANRHGLHHSPSHTSVHTTGV